MKKLIALLLTVAMVAAMAVGCGNKPAASNNAALEGTMEENVNKIIEKNPVEFMGGTMPVDLTDVDALFYETGLQTADDITEAAVFGPMIGSIPFSMVMVRVAEGSDAKTVAESMKAGIDPRKWVCVEADDLMVAGYADVVMLIMVASDSGLTAQSYVDAFGQVVGGEPTVY